MRNGTCAPQCVQVRTSGPSRRGGTYRMTTDRNVPARLRTVVCSRTSCCISRNGIAMWITSSVAQDCSRDGLLENPPPREPGSASSVRYLMIQPSTAIDDPEAAGWCVPSTTTVTTCGPSTNPETVRWTPNALLIA